MRLPLSLLADITNWPRKLPKLVQKLTTSQPAKLRDSIGLWMENKDKTQEGLAARYTPQ